MANAGFYAQRIDSMSDCVALTAAPQSNWKTQVELVRVKLIYQSTAQQPNQLNQPPAIMKMQFIQRCVVVLAMVAVSAQAQGDRNNNINNNQVPANNAQWTQPQGNAQVQPFVDEQRSGFVNDVNNNNAAAANVNANADANTQNSQQLTVSDFQNAGFSAEDAQRIVANLSVGSNRDAVVVQPTTTSVTSTATVSTAAAPVTPAAPTSVSTTPSQPAAAASPVAAEGSSAFTTAAATPAVTTSAPATTTPPVTTAPPKLTMSPAAVEASTPAPPAATSAATSAATTTKSVVTALSVDLETPEDSSSSAASKGAGAATWLAGGVGCVLAVAAMAALYRRKTMRPKTPGTPAEQKATYFHCEARLTPPVYVV